MFVVANDSMGYDAVLGRNFMKKARLRLVQETQITKTDDNNVNSRQIFEVKNNDNEEPVESCKNEEDSIKDLVLANDIFSINYDQPKMIENLRMGDNINSEAKKKIENLVEKYLVKSIEPKESDVKCEMKLFLDNPKPFHFPVRRLAFVEKQKLQEILDEYLEKGFIRPSASEYASAIVLVKKKKVI